jgi:hypothetical protein
MADFTWINDAPIVKLASKEELAARAWVFLGAGRRLGDRPPDAQG